MKAETLIRYVKMGNYPSERKDRALSDLLDEAIFNAEEKGDVELASRLQAAFDELTEE